MSDVVESRSGASTLSPPRTDPDSPIPLCRIQTRSFKKKPRESSGADSRRTLSDLDERRRERAVVAAAAKTASALRLGSLGFKVKATDWG